MVGEFKDDQLQNHNHVVNINGVYFPSLENTNATYGNAMRAFNNTTTTPYDFELRNARKGDVTRTKSKGVKYIIKTL